MEKQAVIDTLLQIATKWVAVGVLLGIPYDKIQMFEAEDDLERRVFKLAEAWLGKNLGVEPTWRKLVEVIASKAGGDHQALAKRLASDHPVTEEQGKYRAVSVWCYFMLIPELLRQENSVYSNN